MDLATFAANWPTDWIVIAVVMFIVALESFRAGTTRGTTVALSLPLTLYLFDSLQKSYLLGDMLAKISVPFGQAIVFVVLLAATYFFISRIISSFDVGGGMVPALACAVSTTIILLVIWAQSSALTELWHLSPAIQAAFGEIYRFFWTLFALGLLAFARS